MLKTSIYISVLAILGLGIYFFIIKDNDNPFGNDEAGFTIKDTASIGKIFLASYDGELVTLDRSKDGWIFNGKYKALPATVNTLLTTFATQKALYPVTKNAYDVAIKSLSTNGTKVELYDLKGKKMRVFYVGHLAATNSGTNMLIDGAKTPYVVQTPAFTGDLATRYTTRWRDWRDRTVFNYNADEIKSVSVQYEQNKINSFVISRNGSGYEVKGDPEVTTKLDTLHTTRAALYMGYFKNINCEGIMNGLQGLDTAIMTTQKMSTIDIETTHGTKQHLDVYWMPFNRRSKNQSSKGTDIADQYDADRMFAIMDGSKDTVMIQTNTFRKIFRQAFQFYNKEVAVPNVPHPNNTIFSKKQ